MASYNLVNISSGNVLVPDCTKALPKPILTNHQWSLVGFTEIMQHMMPLADTIWPHLHAITSLNWARTPPMQLALGCFWPTVGISWHICRGFHIFWYYHTYFVYISSIHNSGSLHSASAEIGRLAVRTDGCLRDDRVTTAAWISSIIFCFIPMYIGPIWTTANTIVSVLPMFKADWRMPCADVTGGVGYISYSIAVPGFAVSH